MGSLDDCFERGRIPQDIRQEIKAYGDDVDAVTRYLRDTRNQLLEVLRTVQDIPEDGVNLRKEAINRVKESRARKTRKTVSGEEAPKRTYRQALAAFSNATGLRIAGGAGTRVVDGQVIPTNLSIPSQRSAVVADPDTPEGALATLHEIGHVVHQAITPNLNEDLDEAYMGMAVDGGEDVSRSDAELVEEGQAEAFLRYVTGDEVPPAYAAAIKALNDSDPALAEAIAELKADMQSLLDVEAPGVWAARSQVPAQTFTSAAVSAYRTAYRKLVDPLARAMSIDAATAQPELQVGLNHSLQAYMMAGSRGRVLATFGIMADGKKVGPSITEVLHSVKPDRRQDFAGTLILQRSMAEIQAQTGATIEEVLEATDGGPMTPAIWDRLQKANGVESTKPPRVFFNNEPFHKALRDWEQGMEEFSDQVEQIRVNMDALLDLRVVEGSLTEEEAKKFRDQSPSYIPISRDFTDVLELRDPAEIQSTPEGEFEGSARPVYYENMLQNLQSAPVATARRIARNQLTLAMLEADALMGDSAERIATVQPVVGKNGADPTQEDIDAVVRRMRSGDASDRTYVATLDERTADILGAGFVAGEKVVVRLEDMDLARDIASISDSPYWDFRTATGAGGLVAALVRIPKEMISLTATTLSQGFIVRDITLRVAGEAIMSTSNSVSRMLKAVPKETAKALGTELARLLPGDFGARVLERVEADQRTISQRGVTLGTPWDSPETLPIHNQTTLSKVIDAIFQGKVARTIRHALDFSNTGARAAEYNEALRRLTAENEKLPPVRQLKRWQLETKAAVEAQNVVYNPLAVGQGRSVKTLRQGKAFLGPTLSEPFRLLRILGSQTESLGNRYRAGAKLSVRLAGAAIMPAVLAAFTRHLWFDDEDWKEYEALPSAMHSRAFIFGVPPALREAWGVKRISASKGFGYLGAVANVFEESMGRATGGKTDGWSAVFRQALGDITPVQGLDPSLLFPTLITPIIEGANNFNFRYGGQQWPGMERSQLGSPALYDANTPDWAHAGARLMRKHLGGVLDATGMNFLGSPAGIMHIAEGWTGRDFRDLVEAGYTLVTSPRNLELKTLPGVRDLLAVDRRFSSRVFDRFYRNLDTWRAAGIEVDKLDERIEDGSMTPQQAGAALRAAGLAPGVVKSLIGARRELSEKRKEYAKIMGARHLDLETRNVLTEHLFMATVNYIEGVNRASESLMPTLDR